MSICIGMLLLFEMSHLLFFSTDMHIYDHQFPVCGRSTAGDSTGSADKSWTSECEVNEFVVLVSKSLLLLCRGNKWWQCCDLLSLSVPYFSLRTPAEKVGRLWPPLLPPRSCTACQRYSWRHPVGDVLEHTERVAKLKRNKYSERYIEVCAVCLASSRGRSVAKLRSRSSRDCFWVTRLRKLQNSY